MKKKRTCDVDFEYFNGGSPRTIRKLYKKTQPYIVPFIESFDYSSSFSISKIFLKLMILRTILTIIRINTIKRIILIFGIS